MPDYPPEAGSALISSEVPGKAFEPEMRFENPDGSDIVFNTDYTGTVRPESPAAGPVQDAGSSDVIAVMPDREKLQKAKHSGFPDAIAFILKSLPLFLRDKH